jgi:F0F1-type ATP synthase assembly protein I
MNENWDKREDERSRQERRDWLAERDMVVPLWIAVAFVAGVVVGLVLVALTIGGSA